MPGIDNKAGPEHKQAENFDPRLIGFNEPTGEFDCE